MLRPLVALAVAAAALVAAAPSARAIDVLLQDSVDLQVVGNAAIRGTLRPASERENLLLRLPLGAKVRAAAKRRGRSALAPATDLALDGEVVAAGATKGRVNSLRTAELAESGDYRVRVFGDGLSDGDYQATVATSYRRRWSGAGGSLDGIAVLQFQFGAPAGAMARIRLSPARGSAFSPSLFQLVGPPGFAAAPLSGATTSWLPLGPTGTYSVLFQDGGTSGGDWVCSVQLRLPRQPKAKVDISAGALTGSFSNDQAVYGRQVGADGGLVDPPDNGGVLDGTSVSIPPGSLPFPVVVTITPAPPFEIGGQVYGAGPAISFGPDGTDFAEGLPASLTIPYDPNLYGDPGSELTVYVKDPKTGEISPVLPTSSYDFSVPGVVTFPSPHFSTYVASRTGVRPLAGDWVVLSVESQQNPEFGGAATISCADLSIVGDTTWSAYVSGSREEWYRSFDDGQGGGPRPRAFRTSLADTPGGNISLLRDDLVFLEDPQNEETTVFDRSERGNVLVHEPVYRGGDAQILLGLRRAKGSPTRTNLAGRYQGHFLIQGAEDDPGGGSPRLRLEGGRFTATFGVDGKVTISGASTRRFETEFPDGVWGPAPTDIPPKWTVAPAGRDVLVYLGDVTLPQIGQEIPPPDEPLPPYLRFRPCLDGDVLVAAAESTDLDVLGVVLVREGSSLKAADVAGPSYTFGVSIDTVDRTDPGAQGFSWLHSADNAAHTPPRSLSVTPLGAMGFTHSAAGDPIASIQPVEFPPPVLPGTFSLSPGGAYSDSTGVKGTFSAHGDVLVGVQVAPGNVRLTCIVPGLDRQYD